MILLVLALFALGLTAAILCALTAQGYIATTTAIAVGAGIGIGAIVSAPFWLWLYVAADRLWSSLI